MSRPFVSVIIGIVLAAFALFVVYNSRLPANQAQAAPAVLPTQKILVASADLAFGDEIKPDFIKEVLWPADYVPADAALDKDDVLSGPEGTRIAIKSFVVGEPLLKTKISGYGEKPTLSRKIADDKRAFSIRINDVSGVAGFLLPGDHVDVQLTRHIGKDRQNLITDVIIQNVSVLGIDQLANEESENPVLAKTATVEVTPEQAQKLALAQQLGTLSLMLRNYTDLEEADVSRISVSDLALEKKKPTARNDGIYVRVRKGTDVKAERVPQ